MSVNISKLCTAGALRARHSPSLVTNPPPPPLEQVRVKSGKQRYDRVAALGPPHGPWYSEEGPETCRSCDFWTHEMHQTIISMKQKNVTSGNNYHRLTQPLVPSKIGAQMVDKCLHS